MSLCQSIDTLAMAYLDDELVAEERRELELHILECTPCRAHVDSERADLGLVRKALIAPPAPDMLKARISRALDIEDKEQARSLRRRLSQWILPGSATVAAAAAIMMFVFGLKTPVPANNAATNVAQDVVRQQARAMPMEVQGPSTGPWLKAHFDDQIEPPRFTQPNIQLVGARLTSVAGHEAALLRYVVSMGGNQFTLTAVLIAGLKHGSLEGGQAIKVGERTLNVHDANGVPAVTYVDDNNMGYTFAAERLSPQELLELVVSSDLIGRAQQGR